MKTLSAVHLQAVLGPMGDGCSTLGCQAHAYISADRPGQRLARVRVYVPPYYRRLWENTILTLIGHK